MTRLIILGVLAIILLVPQLLVWGLIEARQDSYREAQRSICKPWGGEQMVALQILGVILILCGTAFAELYRPRHTSQS